MFERFTASARSTVIGAQQQARALDATSIGAEHLLLAMYLDDGDPTRSILEAAGADEAAVRAAVAQAAAGPALDGEALGALGIDLDEVRRRVEARFGEGALDAPPPARSRWWLRRSPAGGGHLRFTDDAKLVLELSLREALALKSRSITRGHLLLGLLRGESTGVRVLDQLGVDRAALRERAVTSLRLSA